MSGCQVAGEVKHKDTKTRRTQSYFFNKTFVSSSLCVFVLKYIQCRELDAPGCKYWQLLLYCSIQNFGLDFDVRLGPDSKQVSQRFDQSPIKCGGYHDLPPSLMFEVDNIGLIKVSRLMSGGKNF